jgi:N-acetyl-gamma-glutamyl-phosphate reductase
MITAAIIGASGYSGAELLRLLSMRSDVHVKKVTAHTFAGKKVEELYPVFSGRVGLEYEAFSNQLDGVDVSFVSLPSGEAMNIVPQLIPSVGHIIDLSGDFRLPSAALYETYYHQPHSAPSMLGQAVYGLPELFSGSIKTARLVANPGCYATSVILALAPALKHAVVAPDGIVVNSLSGISGAGRSSSIDLSFSEINENVRAYKVGTHQHTPEIQTILEQETGKPVSLSFVPHLVPITRGIYTTIHARLNSPVNEAELIELYQSFYRDAPFVRIKRKIPQIKDVLYTNYCDIGLTVDRKTNDLILISVIDNLVKGAAGQAVQNMNLMFGIPQEQGLLF